MPSKPLLIYDGGCNFCRKWIARWRTFTQDSVDYAPFQEVGKNFSHISTQEFERSVQLIDPSGKVYQGAEAVFRTLAFSDGKKYWFTLYQKFPGFKWVSEIFYRLVAKNRVFFSLLTRFLWGETVSTSTYYKSTNLFLKYLGIIYLIAFLSFWSQMSGLIGSQGILPAKTFLESASSALGTKKLWVLPTLCWLNASDLFLNGLCVGGAVFSLFVIFGFFPSFALFFCWLFYLSLTSVSRDFMAFQWDILLLETGFLAIFLAPLNRYCRSALEEKSSPRIMRLLLKWLLFRLMFLSGMVKLASGDPVWRDLTALTYHYETQPLSTWIGWYAHELPLWFQKLSCVLMFGIELIVPFFIFTPRRTRHFACFILIFFQILIMLTGNYCFFNLLTIALCLLLLDDSFWVVTSQDISISEKTSRSRYWPKWVAWPLAVFIFTASLVPLTERAAPHFRAPVLAKWIYGFFYPFNIVNGYGLFAMMTTSRPEIIVEGSNDRTNWLPYEFKYKAGDLARKPKFNEPHQPRLDWQMWFAALGNYQTNPWFINFCVRLLEGSPSVLKLIEKNPFPDAPPQYIRASIYLYHFTDFAEKKETKNWWKRDYQGPYIPTLSLK